jgi:hypothetical protein
LTITRRKSQRIDFRGVRSSVARSGRKKSLADAAKQRRAVERGEDFQSESPTRAARAVMVTSCYFPSFLAGRLSRQPPWFLDHNQQKNRVVREGAHAEDRETGARAS